MPQTDLAPKPPSAALLKTVAEQVAAGGVETALPVDLDNAKQNAGLRWVRIDPAAMPADTGIECTVVVRHPDSAFTYCGHRR